MNRADGSNQRMTKVSKLSWESQHPAGRRESSQIHDVSHGSGRCRIQSIQLGGPPKSYDFMPKTKKESISQTMVSTVEAINFLAKNWLTSHSIWTLGFTTHWCRRAVGTRAHTSKS